jgi:hypothetical protein
MPASVSVKKETFKNKIEDLLFLQSSILMADSATERTDSVNIPQHAVLEEVNIGLIDKMPTRNTTNINTCILSRCYVECYYNLKPFPVSLCFNLHVKNFILLLTRPYFVWTKFATKKFMYIVREGYVLTF